MTVSRSAVAAEARTWIGVPWRHLGRARTGVDCVGLVVMICRELGLTDYDLAAYPREPKGSDFLTHFLVAGGARVPFGAEREGDLVLFREQRFPCHVGVLVDGRYGPAIVHAHAARRAVLEEPMAGEWLGKRLAAIAIPGVV